MSPSKSNSNTKHYVFDWDGTIAKKEVAEEASVRRCKTLDISMTSEKMRELQKTHAHYDINKEALQKYTGVTDKRMLTAMMTELFRLHYLGVVNEWKEEAFYPEMIDVVKKLHKQGHALSIATTLRTDIIENSLKTLGIRNLFGQVYGNNPELDYSKEQLVKQALKDCKEVHYMIGDREDDLLAGKAVKARTAFASWGHGELKDKSLADVILSSPKDLLNL